MLISMICAPESTLRRAESAIICGSPPAICTATGSASPSWSRRRRDFLVFHSAALDVTISDTAKDEKVVSVERIRDDDDDEVDGEDGAEGNVADAAGNTPPEPGDDAG